MTVYLLHLSRGIPRTPKHMVRHYLGATMLTLEGRLRRHRTGSGAALLREAAKRGIEIRVARVWKASSHKGAFKLEIELKRGRNHAKLCPFCVGNKMKLGVTRESGTL